MNLPAAGPGISNATETFPSRCWADVDYPSGKSAYQCRVPVDIYDDLGLCEEHRTELLSLDDFDRYTPATHQE